MFAADVIAPYGTWPSPLSAQVVAAQGIRLGAVSVDGQDIYWIEGRPQEAGRSVLVRRRPDGSISDVIPPGFNVRSRVHEYGGGAYLVDQGNVYFTNFADQRIYTITGNSVEPTPVTPAGKWHYADYAVDRILKVLHIDRFLIASRGDEGRLIAYVGYFGASPDVSAW